MNILSIVLDECWNDSAYEILRRLAALFHFR
jgi:hypothetical protein